VNSKQHARLSQKQITEIYNKEFDEEYHTLVANIRNAARGNEGFSRGWTDWIGMGAISIGVILINALFATLVVTGVVGSIVSLAVGVPLAIIGVIASLAFQKYRVNRKREIYRNAELFVEYELTKENVEKLRTKYHVELNPVLEVSTPNKINLIMKAVMASLANLIINKKVKNFNELEQLDSRSMLTTSMQQPAYFTMNTNLINELISNLPAPVKPEKKAKAGLFVEPGSSVSTLQATMWQSNAKIELQFQESNVEDNKNNSDLSRRDSLCSVNH